MKKSVSARRHPPQLQVGLAGVLINLSLLIAMIFVTPHASAEPAAQPETAGKIRIVAFGDSLTAGYGLKPGQAFPDVLQMALKSRGHDIEVINAGVSGDTTAAGLARLDWAIGEGVDAVIVELGANDALRGQPPEETRSNLDKILKRLTTRGLPVLLAGMRSPENWGSDYRDRFDAVFADLAAKYDVLLYPFFLDGVATDRKLNLDDGLHPNARGIAIIVANIVPKVEDLLTRVRKRQTAGGINAGR